MAAEPLTTLDGDQYRATFVGRIPPRRGRADMRRLLRFEPDIPAGRICFDPAVPERMLPLRIENLFL